MRSRAHQYFVTLRNDRHSAMIRPFLTETALFLAPFVGYAVFLWATRAGVLHPAALSLRVLAWLTIAALTLMVGSFVVIAQFTGSPPPPARPTSRRIWRTASSCPGG